MDNTKLMIALGGGLLAYWFYVDGKKNSTVSEPMDSKKIKIKEGKKVAPNGTTTPIAKVGGNPKTEEQPLISTNNAQQPPTIVEDRKGVI